MCSMYDKNVHKLITLNTPHSGSPLGDVFGPVLDQHPIIAGIVDHWIHFKPDVPLMIWLGFKGNR